MDASVASRRRIVVASSIAYFLRFVALGAFFPYLFLWLDATGHDPLTSSALGAMYRSVAFVSPLALGALADLTRRHRAVFLAGLVVNAAAVFLLPLSDTSIPCIAALLCLAAASDTGALLDAMIVRSLACVGAASLAPRTRSLGAVAWCLSAPLFGLISRVCGYAFLFRLYSPLVLLAIPVCIVLPVTSAYAATATASHENRSAACDDDAPLGAAEEETADAAHSGERGLPFPARLRAVCGSTRTVSVLALIGMCGAHFGMVFTFALVYFEHDLDAHGAQLGATLTAQALLEIPLFHVAAPLLRSIGLRTGLLSCMLAAAVRLGGYASAASIWTVYPFELAHGWIFALYFTSSALLAEEFTVQRLQATVLGLASSVQNAGALCATLIWGALAQRVGLRTAFGIGAALFAAASLPLLASGPRLAACTVRAARQVCRWPRASIMHFMARQRLSDAPAGAGARGTARAHYRAHSRSSAHRAYSGL